MGAKGTNMLKVQFQVKQVAKHIVKRNIFYVDTDNFSHALKIAKQEAPEEHQRYLLRDAVISQMEVLT